MRRTLKRFHRSLIKRRHLLGPLAKLPILKQLTQGAEVLAGQTSYESWMRQELGLRPSRYPYAPQSGLLSLITTVWNTHPHFLRVLAESIFRQQTVQPFEWVVLDNGTQEPATREYLEKVVRVHPYVKYLRVEQNLGIIRGMHLVMQQATGRYIVPVDSDDYLYPDAISILASSIQRHNQPALLYSDEDHLLGNRTHDPYFKPDWDPVLFANSCYIAHLCAIDRALGESLEIYTDPATNGSHDWDTFTRFVNAGHTPVHIPEVLYSWRMHPNSTAGDITSKDYIYSSQQQVLKRYLEAAPGKKLFNLELSPLFKGTPDWRLKRQQCDPCPMTVVVLGGTARAGARHNVLKSFDWAGHTALGFPLRFSLRDLARLVQRAASHDGLVAFLSSDLEIQHPEWAWQALGMTELHKDLALVGGRICGPNDETLDAGRYLGYGRGCDCPDRGQPMHHVGYHAQLFKERSVDAVPLQFCVFKAGFLAQLLADRRVLHHATLFSLSMWAGAAARRWGLRVGYSPFLTACSLDDWQLRISEEDQRSFVRCNADVLFTSKNYPQHCDLTAVRPYQEATSHQRREHLERQLLVCGVHPRKIPARNFAKPDAASNLRVA